MKRRELLIRAGVGLLVLAPLPDPLAAAETGGATGKPEVEVERRSGGEYPVFLVQAHMTVQADTQRVWRVLTDYDRLAGFVPNLSSSQLVSRDGGNCVVAQEGFGKFLFIRQPIHLLMQAHETPFSHIALTLLKGNMHEYRADWSLQSAADGDATRIVYSGVIAPMFYIPSLFGSALMKSDLRNMMSAVAAEIEKPAQ